ncbi:MAG TPA: PhzF family phenazine biosynthesis isomerase [Kineosporiaceae bacterium]|nr:PhzF family phenazine biosynthesis isomerase [Kineosporiaceae bacterium]
MKVLRYAAFTRDPSGGNPAGVVLDARGESDDAMQQVAADLGFAETAFLLPHGQDAAGREAGIRYFSPRAEVPFCGHATIATAVAHAERFGPGRLLLDTRAGPVEVVTTSTDDGALSATLTSVPPRVAALPADLLAALLATLDWAAADLDPRLPPRLAFAGAWHPIIAAATREQAGQLIAAGVTAGVVAGRSASRAPDGAPPVPGCRANRRTTPHTCRTRSPGTTSTASRIPPGRA